jgi:hypothetical protein
MTDDKTNDKKPIKETDKKSEHGNMKCIPDALDTIAQCVRTGRNVETGKPLTLKDLVRALRFLADDIERGRLTTGVGQPEWRGDPEEEFAAEVSRAQGAATAETRRKYLEPRA